MRVPQRTDRVLQFLEARTRTPGEAVKIDPNPDVESHRDKVTAYYQLLAHSESIGWNDLKYLLDHLVERRLVRKLTDNWHEYPYVLEVRGFERLDELRKVTPASEEAFVAMWFSDKLKPAYVNGIKLAIEDAGYKAVRVDEQHFLEKIDDEVISRIRRARFVVADFSHGKDGARGSVYYEAGFAHGLGLDVIFTCRHENSEDLHFDTRQYPHIIWKDYEDLRKQLRERITALMSDGPRKLPNQRIPRSEQNR